MAQVADAANKLGYKASSAAARLAGGSTGSVAIIVPTATTWFFAQAVEAAEEVFADSGWDTVLISLRNDRAVQSKVLGDLDSLAQRVDGVLLLDIELEHEEIAALSKSSLKVASVGMSGVPWDNVGIDDEHAGWLATNHLLELGHWELAVLTGHELDGTSVCSSRDRLAGFHRAMAEHDLEVHPDLVVAAGSTIQGGQAAMTEILANREVPTAIFAACDEAAFGALMALREHGKSAPRDVSVIGLDNHPMSWFMGLTTVSQPVADQSAFAANLLCEQLSAPHNETDPAHHMLDVTLVERKTARRKR